MALSSFSCEVEDSNPGLDQENVYADHDHHHTPLDYDDGFPNKYKNISKHVHVHTVYTSCNYNWYLTHMQISIARKTH